MGCKRSDGILVLGIIAIVFGIWSLLHDFSSVWLALRDHHVYSAMLQTRGPKAAQLYLLNSIYSLISYILFIVSGIAVLKVRNWARILLVLTSVVDFVLSVILIPYAWTTVMSNQHSTVSLLPTPIPILYIMNVWFLNKKRIREQFKLRHKGEVRPQEVRPQ
jgi:glucan phosphoethanolaminetransferase (alkaline phosphatase superfamily)